ncbi:MAG: flavin-containing monooxygenase [Acidimicrobiales bacterium]
MVDLTRPLADTDDESIRAAVALGVLPPLLTALAGTLDDRSLIPEHLRPDLSIFMDPTYGLSPAQVEEGTALAVEAIARLRDAPARDARALPLDELRDLLAFATGGGASDDYLELLRDELNLGEDLRTPTWRREDVAPDRPFRVAVIGAGMSGLAAAHRLNQAGIEVVVLEKNADVGGTWLENSYPGCRVDVSNLFYCYSFAQRDDWPQHFSTQEVLLEYFRGVADRFGLRPLIRFGTEVLSAALDEGTMRWTLQVRDDAGDSTIEADAIVSGVGQLNRPNIPDLPGASTFRGPAFHSARWDHDVDLTEKRVVVIGTGASAAQLVPEIAEPAAHLTILQRTPAWFLPTPDYRDDVEPEVAWLLRNVPGYTNWLRFWNFWQNVEGLMVAARVDAEWDTGGASVSQVNELIRQLFAQHLQAELADRPDLLEAVMPHYPPFSKRFIRDDGAWARTILRDDVDLVTSPIAEITPDGVRTEDGVLHEADVLIYGTGFTASDFLMPMRIVGRDGIELHDRWKGDARAFLGITLPGYPNLFLLYGPNTNIVVNGSITYFSECEVHHVVGCIEALLRHDAKALEPTQAAHDAFNEEVDAENLQMAWGVASVNSWYRNATGRTAQNWPFSLREYWERTRVPDLDDYVLHR